MTWVVGANCFNGFVCVADIQATIIFHNGTKKYFNCVQKIHKVYKNLCVAFSGDIKSGLIIIERLQNSLRNSILENCYFDIDGHSKDIINFLKTTYKEINPNTNPPLEFVFLWNSQEGDGEIFRPFCMKFKSPDFSMNSTSFPGVAQSGSGLNNLKFNAIAAFLTGKRIDSTEYNEIFSDIDIAPNIITVENFKNILLNEASKVDQPGVSKSFMYFESVIAYDKIFDDETHKNLTQAFKTLGITPSKVDTANHFLILSSLDPIEIKKRFEHIKQNQPLLYSSLMGVIRDANKKGSIKSICQLPEVTKGSILSDSEIIHSYELITTWQELVDFLNEEGVDIKAESFNAVA